MNLTAKSGMRAPAANVPGTARTSRSYMAAAVVLAGLALLAACSGAKKGAMPPVPVTAAEAVKKDVPVVLTAIGTVQAFSSVAIKAMVAGQIMKVHVSEGQDVKKGDLLFTIDPRPVQAALQQAEAGLARDKAQLVSADAQSRRYSDLVKKDYVTQQQADDATANAGALTATVRADEADVQNARLNLAYCSIRAPIDGRLGNLTVKEGNLVKANDTPSLVTLNQIMPVYVAFSVPEQQLSEIRRQAAGDPLPVSATFPDRPETKFAGQLTFIDNAVDNGTGTILLKATFPNADKSLWPGQYVNVSLVLSTLKDAITVPEEAVQQGQQGYYVYVIKADGTTEMHIVKVVQRLDGEATISDGVEGGDKVVTDGQLRIFPGAKVSIVPAQAGSQTAPGQGAVK